VEPLYRLNQRDKVAQLRSILFVPILESRASGKDRTFFLGQPERRFYLLSGNEGRLL
jgi:hypothetical protein